MSSSACGILTYGYDLGGANGWKLKELSEYDELVLPWLDEEEEEFVASAEAHLLRTVGEFTEDWPDAPYDSAESRGYYARKRSAEESIGVKFVDYGHYDVGGIILATAKIESGGWESLEIDPDELRPEVGWSTKLHAALKALELKPTQVQPRWILAASYG